MNAFFSSTSGYITSLFTREYGYTNIESNAKYSKKKSIHILNSFTPQGASPDISLRIGSYDNLIGIGYYHMENNSDARLSTLFTKYDDNIRYKFIDLPTKEQNIREFTVNTMFSATDVKLSVNMLTRFDQLSLSILFYSIMAGDNIIVIHPDHELRLQLFSELLRLFPVLMLQYNRLTTNCTELDGNENIIGVSTLPPSYRSHDKLHLPLDTIFVDLTDYRVTGGGVKNNKFTDVIADSVHYDNNPRDKITDYFDKAMKYNDDYQEKIANYHLIQKIRINLGIEREQSNEWLTSF